MPKNPIEELQALAATLPSVREQFKTDVANVCSEVNIIATQIAGAIGEVSIEEAKKAIIREFTAKLTK